MRSRTLAALLSLCAAAAPAAAQASTSPAITSRDLKTRLYILADDSMLGRQAGTDGNLKATAYIAAEAKRIGLVPAGDSGGWFQWIPLVRRSFPDTILLRADTTPLAAPAQWIPFGARGTPRPVDGARVVYGGVFGDSTTWISAREADGRFVVLASGARMGLPFVRAGSRFAGAAGVAVAGLERLPAPMRRALGRPSMSLRADAGGALATPQILLVTNAAAAILLGRPLDSAHAGDTGAVVHGTVPIVETPVPARNVVAILPGSDPKKRGEYVALGAHSDHIGIRSPGVDHDSLRAYNTAVWELRGREPGTPQPTPEQLAAIHVNVDSLRRIRPARTDSINNGADDDGSGSVSLLEIAQAAASVKPHPKRSLLFVWHTAEELGLLGSRWFTEHPTVPRDSIVAQLNIDMIGRGDSADIKGGGPRYVELVGSFRLSTELGNTAERVNKARAHPFAIDYTFDANGHPENIYCRSDHANYARYGIPVIFFTTGLHEDYHQVTDEPQYIDYAHMAAVAQWIHDIAIAVADQPNAPVVDKPKPADPNAPCRQ